MSGTPFFKLSGAGNDFIALTGTADELPCAEQIRTWCRRRISLGADGLFVLERMPADEAPDRWSVRMHYFNSDGSRAELCGNGTRCAARLARHLGWFDTGAAHLTLITDAGRLAVRLDADEAEWAELATPPPPQAPRVFPLGDEPALRDLRAVFVVVGVPHLVIARRGNGEPRAGADDDAQLADFDLPTLGPLLRHHDALGPDGANVNFVVPARAENATASEPNRIAIRTWERGVEGETLACGSGAVASALASDLLFGLGLPVDVRVRSGDVLSVRSEGGPARATLFQSGPARLVAEGVIL